MRLTIFCAAACTLATSATAQVTTTTSSFHGPPLGYIVGPDTTDVDSVLLDENLIYIHQSSLVLEPPIELLSVHSHFDPSLIFGSPPYPEFNSFAIGEGWIVSDDNGIAEFSDPEAWGAILFAPDAGSATSGTIYSYGIRESALADPLIDEVQQAASPNEIGLDPATVSIRGLDPNIALYTTDEEAISLLPEPLQIYFTVTPATVNDLPSYLSEKSAATIYTAVYNNGWTVSVFAGSSDLGISNLDEITALEVDRARGKMLFAFPDSSAPYGGHLKVAISDYWDITGSPEAWPTDWSVFDYRYEDLTLVLERLFENLDGFLGGLCMVDPGLDSGPVMGYDAIYGRPIPQQTSGLPEISAAVFRHGSAGNFGNVRATMLGWPGGTRAQGTAILEVFTSDPTSSSVNPSAVYFFLRDPYDPREGNPLHKDITVPSSTGAYWLLWTAYRTASQPVISESSLVSCIAWK